ncbi:hypothetical protein BKA70DRAFT_1394556, partial [Coprinopsis sp. MPI-PUGE-AT-0042]
MFSKVHLPPEVWFSILRSATLDTRPSNIGNVPSMTATVYEEWKSSMVTKRRIVRVCRDWYSIGIPFMYEHIVVETASASSHTGRMYRKRPLSTRCLVLLDVIPSGWILGIMTQAQSVLPSPYRCSCTISPNLRTFTAAATYTITTDVFDALPLTLEHFECRGDGSRLSPKAWGSFLTSHPNLRSTVLPGLELRHETRSAAFRTPPLLPQLVEL